MIESGEYFKQARAWYNEIFLYPILLRSIISVALTSFVVVQIILLFNINALFPLNKQVMYIIGVEDTLDYAADINKADSFGDDTFKSIAAIFLDTYFARREGYSYTDLADRMLFVQNTSTRAVFNKYNNFLSLDNPDSIVLKLQRSAKRSVEIKSIEFLSNTDANVYFHAEAYEDNGRNLEDADWKAKISFVLDKINIGLPEGSPFSFIVTDYDVQLVKDYDAK